MHSIDVRRAGARTLLVVAACALVACVSEVRREAPGDARGPVTTPPAESPPGVAQPAPSLPPQPAPPLAGPATRPSALPAPAANRDAAALRRQAAERIVAASPDASHRGAIKEPLLAIPVLEIELERDGRVRRIVVLRHPKQASDTTQLAIDAVRRAEPFGDVSALRRPWVFVETFLFGDDRKFKLRTHDESSVRN